MDDCIFCKIINGDIPSAKVYEDEDVIAFRDVSPQMPVHVLIVPRAHVTNASEAEQLPDAVLAKLWKVAGQLAHELDVDKTGYRLVSNAGHDACQSVQHWHIHLLGGGQMSEKM